MLLALAAWSENITEYEEGKVMGVSAKTPVNYLGFGYPAAEKSLRYS